MTGETPSFSFWLIFFNIFACMKFQLVGLVILLSLLVEACYYEEAKPSKKQYLIVASDFLTYKDLDLFAGFEKKTKVHIVLKAMSGSEIYKTLKKEGSDTRIDVCLLSSSYLGYTLDKNHLLQACSEDFFQTLPPSQQPFISNKRTAFGLGVDPYVLLHSMDTVSIKRYSDLQKSEGWQSDLLEKKDWYPFCVSAISVFGKEKMSMAIRWLDGLLSNKKTASTNDSIPTQHITLTRYSHAVHHGVLKKTHRHKKLIFPNQERIGTFYDIPVAGIVYQARNYENALFFVRYISNQRMNQLLCKRKGYFSFHSLGDVNRLDSGNHAFNIFRITLQQLFDQFDTVRSTLRSVSDYQKKKRIKKSRKKPTVVSDSTQTATPGTSVE